MSTYFESLIIANISYLKKYALQLTRDMESATELLQETLTRVAVHENSFKKGTNFKAWTKTIMRNTFINDYRKNQRIAKFRNQTCLDMFEEGVQNEAVTRLHFEEIMDKVNALSQTLKTPFLMYYKGYRYDEIAQQLHIPMGTVKSRIFFARKQLRSALQAAGEGFH